MTESSSDKLVEALRKAVSRTSMLAEGNDPELDPVVRHIRQIIAKGANTQEILDALSNAEPLLIKIDAAQHNRAKLVRSSLEELINLLEQQNNRIVPQHEKKQLEEQIRSHWSAPSKWPELLKAFQSLAEQTLNSSIDETSQIKSSFFQRFFNQKRRTQQQSSHKELMQQISHTLSGLMNNLHLPSHYDEEVAILKKALLSSDDFQQLPELLDEVINFVMIVVGKTQENLTNYLSHLNKQLASINATVVTSYQSQKSLSESREGLNTKLQLQVEDASKAIQDISDLDSLKTLINNRLETISDTMTKYRTSMLEKEKQAAQSIAMLKNKVTRMEKDSTSLRALLQERLAQAMTDSLTDLPNRTAYQDAIQPLCKLMQEKQQPLCLAVCDIDHFKRVNDTWGHLAGDKVLRLVPKQIRTVLHKEDLFFRYGGEEFVLVFPNTNSEQALQRAESIRKVVEATPFNMQGEPVSVSVSIGVALLAPGEDPESLFSRADKQLYLAKESGRNKALIEG